MAWQSVCAVGASMNRDEEAMWTGQPTGERPFRSQPPTDGGPAVRHSSVLGPTPTRRRSNGRRPPPGHHPAGGSSAADAPPIAIIADPDFPTTHPGSVGKNTAVPSGRPPWVYHAPRRAQREQVSRVARWATSPKSTARRPTAPGPTSRRRFSAGRRPTTRGISGDPDPTARWGSTGR